LAHSLQSQLIFCSQDLIFIFVAQISVFLVEAKGFLFSQPGFGPARRAGQIGFWLHAHDFHSSDFVARARSVVAILVIIFFAPRTWLLLI
jgi:hypothetical protein